MRAVHDNHRPRILDMPRFRFARLSPAWWRHLRAQARQRKIAALIAQSPYFDADFYLAQSPDVAAKPRWAENPALHYLLYGGREGRRPSACFNSRWYLEQYPDVKAAGLNPLQHYLSHGRAEGRIPRPLRALTWHERLWASETTEAQQGALLELERLLDSREGCAQEASAAAWSLGRWYAWMGQWPEAARVMTCFGQIDDPVPGHLAPCLLEIDAVMRVGAFGQAHDRLKWLLERRPDHADLCLLAANLVQAEAAGTPAEIEQRCLDWINRPYVAQGLEPLTLAPAGAESVRLPFDRIETHPPATSARQKRYAAKIDGQALVSVIVPAWNAAKTLETALEGLARQSWAALEVIVVDDCSSDETAAIVERFAARDPRIRLLRHAANQGAYAARNTALASARGAFITNHDSDDWSHPRKIESQVSPLLESDALVATLSHWVRTSDDLRFGQWSTPSGWMGWVHRNVSSLMFRRSVFEQLGYWDRVTVNADTEYYYRVITAFGADRVKEVLPGVPLSFARHSPTSLTQRPETSLRSVFGGMRKAYQDAADRWHAQARTPGDLYVPAYPQRRPFPAPAEMCRFQEQTDQASRPSSVRAASHVNPAVPLPTTLFFVHIPKTAGTSFRKACSRFFGDAAIQCDYGPKQPQTSQAVLDWVYDDTDFFEFAQRLEQTHCRLISGHVNLDRFVALVGLMNTLSFVRDPIERVISHFEHRRLYADYDGTLDEFMALPANRNLQSRLLAAAPLEAIGFVGVTERYEESLALINEAYGLRLPVLTTNCHPERKDRGSYAIDAEARQRILELNRADAELVERANRLLDARRLAHESGYGFVQGAIQSVAPGSVSGFAFVRHLSTPVMVELCINGHPVATTHATAQRPALFALGAPRQGCVGFDFRLAKPLAPGDQIQCLAKLSGQSLGVRTWQPPAPKKK